MALTFSSNKYPGERAEVVKVLSFIDWNPLTFVLISRVFNSKRNNNKDNNQAKYLDEVDGLIEDVFNSPRYAIEESVKRELVELLKCIYRNTKFDKIKSEILEAVIHKYGPYSKCLMRDLAFIEPTITDGDVLVGNRSKIDSVFYISDTQPLEFVECKANIANVIPSNLPKERLSRGDRKKVDYLEKAYIYLTGNLCEPEVYLACYNEDYEDQLENVHKNWGMQFIKFISPAQVYNCMIPNR